MMTDEQYKAIESVNRAMKKAKKAGLGFVATCGAGYASLFAVKAADWEGDSYTEGVSDFLNKYEENCEPIEAPFLEAGD